MKIDLSKDQKKQIATILTAVASILLSAVLTIYFNAKIGSKTFAGLLLVISVIYGASILVIRRNKHVRSTEKLRQADNT
jgi:hypothetical protein